MARVYSHSRISTFESCPLKFKYRYVEKIISPRGNIEAFMGGRVHEALEKLYRDKMFRKICELDDLITFYNQRWEKEIDENIFVVKEEYSPDNYRKMGEKYICDYYNTYKPFNDGKTIALEKMVLLPIDDTGYTVRGIIDRLSEKDGVYEIHDYKTSLNLPTEEEVKKDRQLALYALALKNMYDDANDIELIWHYVAFNKELRIKKDDETLQKVKEDTLNKIIGIEKAIEEDNFYPKESALCPYCEYQHLCPLFKHKYAIENLPPEEARWEDGHSLVNRYWEIESKVKELERMKEELKERIVQYALKNETQYVYGSEKIANVKIYENPWFPDIKDPKRKELEELLKKEGIYEDYMKLDTIALSNAYKKGMAEQLSQKLKEYVRMKKVSRIYLRSIEREE
ncbi:MAG: PD-(D/E)XK nuclease family protein [Candidatus Thermoplasmatota archaeon]|nr:PD-(D/E)XK nuclease family protein [Candidatus Thermoplasmatota archaeon]